MKLVYALLLLLFVPTRLLAVSAVDDLPDLTGGVIPLLSYDTGKSGGGQLFSGGRLSSRGEIHWLVRIKNQSGDPILAESLIVVVHKIQERARLRDVTLELDLPNADGHTKDGLPYFHVPVDSMPYLQPYAESQPFKLEIKNPNLFRLYPPVLRVYGARLTPAQAYQDTLKTLN